MRFLITAVLLACWTLAGSAQVSVYPLGSIRVTVVDEKGKPIQGVVVTGIFAWPKTFERHVTTVVKQTTDTLGKADLMGRAEGGGSSGFRATQGGFYSSGMQINFNTEQKGQWMPFPTPQTVILKSIGAPVPMYAVSNCALTLPEKEGTFGFDLEKRDWVHPHGGGVKADLVFTQQKKEDVVLGSTAMLRVAFSNQGDGLIPLYELQGAESELKLPRTAPIDGFEAERRFTTDWNAGRQLTPPVQPALGYLIRVRTVLDEGGRVKNAWYGTIDGEFEWDPQYFPTSQIKLTYYLNPDGTPNLEFDRERNLFGELPIENTVRRP